MATTGHIQPSDVGKGKKATYILTWDILLPVKVFFSHLSQNKTLEKLNSQYPSEIDLVQQLLVIKQQHNVSFDFTTMPLEINLALSVSQPVSRTHKS